MKTYKYSYATEQVIKCEPPEKEADSASPGPAKTPTKPKRTTKKRKAEETLSGSTKKRGRKDIQEEDEVEDGGEDEGNVKTEDADLEPGGSFPGMDTEKMFL